VEVAAEPPILQAAQGKIGTAVRAAPLKQAEGAVAITEQHEILTEHSHWNQWPGAAELFGKSDGLPISTHPVPAGSTRTGSGELDVVLGPHAAYPHLFD
jgi:hypothetical protein